MCSTQCVHLSLVELRYEIKGSSSSRAREVLGEWTPTVTPPVGNVRSSSHRTSRSIACSTHNSELAQATVQRKPVLVRARPTTVLQGSAHLEPKGSPSAKYWS